MGSVAKELDEDLAAVLDEDRQKGRLFEEASLTRHGCTRELARAASENTLLHGDLLTRYMRRTP